MRVRRLFFRVTSLLEYSAQPTQNAVDIWRRSEFCMYHIPQSMSMCYNLRAETKVSLLGVDSLWGDCTFIPADWGS